MTDSLIRLEIISYIHVQPMHLETTSLGRSQTFDFSREVNMLYILAFEICIDRQFHFQTRKVFIIQQTVHVIPQT